MAFLSYGILCCRISDTHSTLVLQLLDAARLCPSQNRVHSHKSPRTLFKVVAHEYLKVKSTVRRGKLASNVFDQADLCKPLPTSKESMNTHEGTGNLEMKYSKVLTLLYDEFPKTIRMSEYPKILMVCQR